VEEAVLRLHWILRIEDAGEEAKFADNR
jgi:hypothetical protein